ncbi:MAG TPA: 3'-5' exonuclease, partial [Candidatus Paceibacterota bacterium]|nr:3'-5' exonuclease [Candidatus Paceibacterota bacterium]
WRGSNFEIFLNFERDWPEAQVVLLEENYRSSGNIIAAASELISHNSKQKKKKLWTKNEPGEMVRLIETADEEDEAAWLVEDIMEARRAAPEESIAILYRTNAQSRPLEQALIEEQIPYRIYGGLKFYERREVKDIVAALRYAANPLDSVSRERLEKEFTKTRFRALEPRLRESGALRPTEIIELFIRETDYYTYIAKNLTNILDRRENIAELIRFAAEFEELPPLLEHVSLVQSTDTPSSEQGSRMPVQLMTMHLAKGLEFDRVYIVGVNEGLLPHNRSTYNLAELEEERRLMYVGMTRARKHLALSFYDVPSRFLSEIPSEYLDFKSQVSDAEEFSDDEERYITYD